MIIASRFNGPPGTGNGGYSAGLVADHVDAAAVEVTLRTPPPLDTQLTVDRETNGDVAVRDGDVLVATGRPSEVSALAPRVEPEHAERVSQDFPGFAQHPFPTCFSCGWQRTDGLRLFPGRLPGGRTAAPFLVPDDVDRAIVWAALDCPGGWTIQLDTRPHVLGRITARVDAVPEPGARCVVSGALLAAEGRKAEVVTTLWDPHGDPLATAHAVWIAIR